MIKKLFYLSLAGMLVFSFGCADEDLAPVATFDTLGIGAFPRLISLNTGEFDLADLAGSAYDMDVEFVDGAGGEDVAEYNLFLEYVDNNPGNGDNSTSSQPYASFTPADFSRGTEGNLGLNVNIPFTDAASAAGIDPATVLSGDVFRFVAEVVKTDGNVFTQTNSTPAITTSFQGIFNFNVTATCPLPDAEFSGEYNISFEGGEPNSPFGETFSNETATFRTIAGSTTRRRADFLYLTNYNFGVTMEIDFACDVVFMNTINSGVGCGGGAITITQASPAGDPFDINDDSEFKLNLIDFATDGGCGVSSIPFTIVFSK
jgi:hypothetical protein